MTLKKLWCKKLQSQSLLTLVTVVLAFRPNKNQPLYIDCDRRVQSGVDAVPNLKLVSRLGLEPSTNGLKVRCSTR